MTPYIVLTALTLGGCSLTSSSDEQDSRGDQHTLTVNWTIRNADGTPRDCPANFDSLYLSITNAEQSAQEQLPVPCTPTGSQAVEIYTSGEWTFRMPDDPALYVWKYTPNQEVVIYVTDPTNTNVYATSIMRPVTLTSDQSVDVDIYPDAGFNVMHWELRSGTTDSFVQLCGAVAVDQISYTYRDFYDDTAPLVTDTWTCADKDADFPYLASFDVGSGRTRALAAGNYIGTTRALRAGVEVASQADVEIEIRKGNEVIESGKTTLVVADR